MRRFEGPHFPCCLANRFLRGNPCKTQQDLTSSRRRPRGTQKDDPCHCEVRHCPTEFTDHMALALVAAASTQQGVLSALFSLLSARPHFCCEWKGMHSHSVSSSTLIWSSKAMTMTMTRSDKGSTNISQGAWLYGHECRGHNPTKRNLLRLPCLALLVRCATGTLLSTVCGHMKKERRRHRLLLR